MIFLYMYKTGMSSQKNENRKHKAKTPFRTFTCYCSVCILINTFGIIPFLARKLKRYSNPAAENKTMIIISKNPIMVFSYLYFKSESTCRFGFYPEKIEQVSNTIAPTAPEKEKIS